jgi:peptide/nickel transport system permease protein
MAIAAAAPRISLATIFLTLGMTGWLGIARVLRAKTMQIKNLDFVLASRALGQSTPHILLLHVLPNVAGPLVVIATLSVGQMILAESVLSYLGAGVSPPTATWGHMLFEGQDYFQAAPWLVIAPGSMIFLAVLGFHLLGEGLRDALDPRA